jgi:hypothetical protein
MRGDGVQCALMKYGLQILSSYTHLKAILFSFQKYPFVYVYLCVILIFFIFLCFVLC